jgi:prephenate dehydrogenase
MSVSNAPRGPICVIGLGLIGGSLLRAAVAAGVPAWGYNRSAGTAAQARAAGFDVCDDLATALRRAAEADALVVVAVPMPAVDAALAAIARHAPGCALTDVVSVKGPVAAAVAAHSLSARFVGGHPMAGTSESGWVASDVALFRDTVWVVAVEDDTDPDVWLRVTRLALDCGAVVVPAESHEHDRAVARISHLPHLLAETLALAGAAGGELALGLAAGSFRDGTRVAGTAPSLVNAMCEANSAALLDALDEAAAVLADARAALTEGSTQALVAAGHAAHSRYATSRRWEIGPVRVREPGWVYALRDAGRNGGVVRSLDGWD